MKKNYLFASLGLLFGSLVISSCGNAVAPFTPKAGSNVIGLSFQVGSYTFENVGESFTITPTILYKEGTEHNASLYWTNSNPKAVSAVAGEGNDRIVTAKSFGKSTVSAIVGNYIAKCEFTVKDNSEDITFEVDSKSLTLKPGSSSTIHALLNGVIKEDGVSWKSNDEDVATVNNGEITAVAVGETDVVATYNSIISKCHVTVSSEAVEYQLSLNPTSKTIAPRESFTLEVVTNDPSVTVTFSSSNESVATVESNGQVNGLRNGNAVITATGGGKSATCNVTVQEKVDPQKVVDVYFFLDYNNIDMEDTTGKKLLATFKWYQDKPFVGDEVAPIPSDPTEYTDDAFPYFIGWSSHTIIDTKNDLWNLEEDVVGQKYFLYLYGIWSDVPRGEFVK